MTNRRRRGVGPITTYHFALNTLDTGTATVYEMIQRHCSELSDDNGIVHANVPYVVDVTDIERSTGMNKNTIRKCVDKLCGRKFHVEDDTVGVREFNMLNWLGRTTFHIDQGATMWLLSFPMTIEPEPREDRDESWTQGLTVAE